MSEAMIDEAELSELLSLTAATFEVPTDGAANVLAAVVTPSTPERSGGRLPRWQPRRPRLAIGIAAGLVVLIGIFATGALVGQRQTSKFNAVGQATSGASGSASDVGGGVAAGDAGGATGTRSPSAVQPLGEAAKVVKTGSVQLEVRDGAVASSMIRLTTLATGVNGFVADTRTSEGNDDPRGSITLRVPAATFETVLVKVRSLGTVQAVTSHGQDVTAQYTDLQARIGSLNATRNQLLTILQRANGVGEVLAVQDRLNQVQTEIEQLKGQQRVLDDQTSFASLSVEVAEHGAKTGAPEQRTGLAKAWDDARDGFTSGIEAIIGGSGTALLVLMILAVIGVVARLAWVLLRRRLV